MFKGRKPMIIEHQGKMTMEEKIYTYLKLLSTIKSCRINEEENEGEESNSNIRKTVDR